MANTLLTRLTEADALSRLRERLGAQERTDLERVVREVAKRSCEALKLYSPLPHLASFHEKRVLERILRGSNRGGKTLCAAVEVARAVTGQDPFNKYPKKNGLAIIVGKDGKHLANPMYRTLCRSGDHFYMLPETLGDRWNWRAYRPWNEEDRKRVSERRYSPPLIPPRMIKDIGWENKKERIPNIIRLKNGWELTFYTSLGKPPQGIKADLAWFDEEIIDPDWYTEVAARLIDRNGLFIWSATAQLGGLQLYELCERAQKQRDSANPAIVEYFAHIDDNRFFTDQQREAFFEKLTEEQRRIRIEGEFAFTSRKVYPEFSERTHGIDWFQIPEKWTRYMVVDPGRQVCAVLFAAVPPPDDEDPGRVVLYDELYIRQCSAEIFGREVKKKAVGQEFYAFIIDHQGGQVRDMGGGLQVEEQYAAAMKTNGVRSRKTGHGFLWGSTDVESGCEKVRSWLFVRKNGTPKLQYFRDKLPNFRYEMVRYIYKPLPGDKSVLSDKPQARVNHLCDCVRYLAQYDPKHHKPSPLSKLGGIPEILKAKQRRRAKMLGTQEGVSLGPQTRA